MGLAMWAEFADGHVEEIEDRPTVPDLAEHPPRPRPALSSEIRAV